MAVINVVRISKLGGTTGIRMDAEYYDPESIKIENHLKRIPCITIKNLQLRVDGSAFYPSIAEYYQTSGIPFLRVGDIIDGFLKTEDVLFLPIEIADKFSSIRKTCPRDIVITKGGSVGIAAILPNIFNRYALSRDLIVIRTSRLSEEEAISILLFLISKYGKSLLLRGKSQQVQPHLTLPVIKELPIPDFKIGKLVEIYKDSSIHFQKSKFLYSQAENLLLEELGLKDFKPRYKKTYTANLSNVLSAHRIDAEYFQPAYEEVIEKLRENNIELPPLRKFILNIQKGIEVGSENYQNEGKPFIRVSNLSITGFTDKDQKYISEGLYQQLRGTYEPQQGDFLLSKDATPGIAYVVKEQIEGIISSGILKLQIDESEINKEYLALCINSLIGKMQIERDGGGSVILHWKPEQVKRLNIPILPLSTQQKIASLVQESHEARKKAKELLEAAKKAVEIAIENSEEEAVEYISRIA